MDPDQALKDIRALIKKIIADRGSNETDGVELAYKVKDLDNWLLAGGFVPEDWNN
jgi:hypothetical protein